MTPSWTCRSYWVALTGRWPRLLADVDALRSAIAEALAREPLPPGRPLWRYDHLCRGMPGRAAGPWRVTRPRWPHHACFVGRHPRRAEAQPWCRGGGRGERLEPIESGHRPWNRSASWGRRMIGPMVTTVPVAPAAEAPGRRSPRRRRDMADAPARTRRPDEVLADTGAAAVRVNAIGQACGIPALRPADLGCLAPAR